MIRKHKGFFWNGSWGRGEARSIKSSRGTGCDRNMGNRCVRECGRMMIAGRIAGNRQVMGNGRTTERRWIAVLTILSTFIVLCALLFSSCAGQSAVDGDGASLQADGGLSVHFLDVGQADCTLLVSAGEAMLVDAGNRDDSDFIISYLDELGIERLKYIVFTHPHEDHIGSGQAIIERFAVEKVFMLDEYDEGIGGQLKLAIEQKGIPAQAPMPEDTAQLGECSLAFLGPVRDYNDTNDDSICLMVRHGENSLLFTGDAGSAAERDMIEAGFDLEADLLQAGHHGSSASNSYYFLRSANPAYVVVSCGEGNMYGHPHEEALSRFNDLGAEVFRTDTQGTVIAVSNGAEIAFNVEGKKADKPYTAEPEEAAYIGNLNSKKYHLPTCGGLPKEENRVYFMSVDAAEKAGYEPCGNCNPQ